MYTILLTGGLGAGKSTAAGFFADAGARVIDSDAVAASVLGEDRAVLDSVVSTFGEGVLDENGELNRHALAQAAFASAATVKALNSIVHPPVVERIRSLLAALRSGEDPPEVVVIEVPLLADVPALLEAADAVLSIEAPREMRIERAIARGMQRRDASSRIDAQGDDDRRVRLAHDIIENAGDLAEFLGKLRAYWSCVQSRMST